MPLPENRRLVNHKTPNILNEWNGRFEEMFLRSQFKHFWATFASLD